jgi:hypothetical protein
VVDGATPRRVNIGDARRAGERGRKIQKGETEPARSRSDSPPVFYPWWWTARPHRRHTNTGGTVTGFRRCCCGWCEELTSRWRASVCAQPNLVGAHRSSRRYGPGLIGEIRGRLVPTFDLCLSPNRFSSAFFNYISLLIKVDREIN